MSRSTMQRKHICARCECDRFSVAYAKAKGHICGTPEPLHHQPTVELRAQGLTLAEIGQQMGITKEAVRQRLKNSRAPLCRKCKLPIPLLGGDRGNICQSCYATMMANRPSKVARRTGYRTNKSAHRRAAALRLAREGKTLHEIAESLNITYPYASRLLVKIRKAGKSVDGSPPQGEA